MSTSALLAGSLTAHNSERKVQVAQARVEESFAALKTADGSLQGTMLLVSKSEKVQGGAWAKPVLVSQLHTAAGGWVSLPSSKSSGSPSTTLSEAWSRMSWWRPASGIGPDRGSLDDFLHAVGKKTGNGGKSAKKYNQLLAKAKRRGTFERVKPKDKTGSTPWSAPRATLRAVYKFP